MLRSKHFLIFFGVFILFVVLFSVFPEFFSSGMSYDGAPFALEEKKEKKAGIPPLDKEAYDKKLEELANNPPPKIITETITITDESGKQVKKTVPLDPQPIPSPNLWPARNATQYDAGGPVKTIYPKDGAILPFNRIIAYYGNLYSTKMGALGEYPEEEMLARLQAEVDRWNTADPGTPAIPALHYIVVTAQGSPGADGKYRFRMPDKEIDKVLKMADKIPARNASPARSSYSVSGGRSDAGGNAIVFLDFQVGWSTIQTELPLYEKYLKLPNVHVGMDPEFSMKSGIRPGKVVGTYDAADINFAAEYMAKVVKENNLPPKILVVHRYTQKMLTNYQNIKPLPEVQIVMHMDGWGGSAKKKNTYQQFIYKEPVQFAGFKLFYKNDVFEKGTVLMSPEEILKLRPKPIYIQYQ